MTFTSKFQPLSLVGLGHMTANNKRTLHASQAKCFHMTFTCRRHRKEGRNCRKCGNKFYSSGPSDYRLRCLRCAAGIAGNLLINVSSKNKTVCDISAIDRRRIAGNLPIITATWKPGFMVISKTSFNTPFLLIVIQLQGLKLNFST